MFGAAAIGGSRKDVTASAVRGPAVPEAGTMAAAAADNDLVGSLDLDTLRRTVQQQQARGQPAPHRPVVRRVPETTDDFIRNFLVRTGMSETLMTFEREWYRHLSANAASGASARSAASAVGSAPFVPDNYLESTALLNRIDQLERDLRRHAELTTKLTKRWTQAQRDRDFHRASHNRVVQERNRLERLLRQAHGEALEVNPALVELRQRCETLFKAKTLAGIEKDKLEQKVSLLEKRVEELHATVAAQNGSDADSSKAPAAPGGGKRKGQRERKVAGDAKDSVAVETLFTWPPDERVPPAPNKKVASVLQLEANPTLWSCQDSFVAHTQAATKLALHPFKPAVATCSDDGGWRLSALPQGEAIVAASEAHANWVSSVAFHPTGTLLATGSGDKTVKLWSLATNGCRATLQGHTDGVWAVDFQETGALLASGGLDHTARVWDVERGRCLQALRGHVEAVNSVRWQAYTNVLCTGSGDKTVSLWDARMNCCSHSLYGHQNAVLCVAPPPTAYKESVVLAAASGGEQPLQLLSCDADGVVKLWDLRTMQAVFSLNVAAGSDSAYTAANHITFDASCRYAAVACDDGMVRIIDIAEESVVELPSTNGHQDAVLCVAFDPSTNSSLVSCGSDRSVRYWC